MNYYIDTEFLEGTQKTWLGKDTKPTIDLISIGIVTENNKEYYAISKEFNLKEAWNRCDEKVNMDYKPSFGGGSDGHYNPQFIKEYWIRDNVLKPIYYELCLKDEEPLNSKNNPLNFSYKTLKNLINKYGKTNKQIATDIKNFVYTHEGTGFCRNDIGGNLHYSYAPLTTEPKFYGYYADYDWVVFCWLFGKMNNLPAGFPMYCIDLKQISDEIYQKKKKEVLDEAYKKGMKLCFLNSLSEHLKYPKQINEHNALADAKWDRELHKFLNEL